MRNSCLKLVVLSALNIFSINSQAAFVAIPSTGFGTTAYTNCYNAGRTNGDPKLNFGSYYQATNTTINNTCYVTVTNETASPIPNYSLVASAMRYIPAVTGGTATAAINIGNVRDSIWRKPAAANPTTATDMCIIGTRVQLLNADHDISTAGTQYFDVNDVARGGFSASGTVNAGYFLQASNASPVYRIGRTFTSVQHRATSLSSGTNAPGYLDLPGIGNAAAINGVPTFDSPLLVPTALQQVADVNSNWVNFTSDSIWIDTDGITHSVSGVYYVQFACDSTAPATWVKAGAIRLRQTAQENTSFKEISIDGYAPPGATVP